MKYNTGGCRQSKETKEGNILTSLIKGLSDKHKDVSSVLSTPHKSQALQHKLGTPVLQGQRQETPWNFLHKHCCRTIEPVFSCLKQYLVGSEKDP